MDTVGCFEGQTDESLGLLANGNIFSIEQFKVGLVMPSKEIQVLHITCDVRNITRAGGTDVVCGPAPILPFLVAEGRIGMSDDRP